MLFMQAVRVLPSYPEFDKQFYKYPSYLRRSHDFRGAWRRIFVTVLLVSHWRVQAEKGKNLNSRPLVQLCRLSTKTILYEEQR